jgi:hypothetical protein
MINRPPTTRAPMITPVKAKPKKTGTGSIIIFSETVQKLTA